MSLPLPAATPAADLLRREREYLDLLQRYLDKGHEQELMAAVEMAKAFSASRIGPQDIVFLHQRALAALLPPGEAADQALRALDLLLEAMVAYDLNFRAYADLQQRSMQALAARNRELQEAQASLAAEALARARERDQARAVIESTTAGVIVFDAQCRCTGANRRLAELLGLPDASSLVGQGRDTVLSRLGARLEAPENLADLVARFDQAPEGEVAGKLVAPGPPRRVLAASDLPVKDLAGRVAGQLLILRDVTHEDEVDRMKSEFVATVSHELRTPLASIVGFAELMTSRELPAEKLARYAQQVHTEGLRLTALVDDFLDIQRMESGRQEYHVGPVAPASVLELGRRRFAEIMMRRAGAGAAFELVVDEPAAPLPAVSADADRIGQVVTNLLANAVKYSPGGGRVRLRAEAAGPFVRFSVTDEGLGLPAAALGRLFQKFYRVEREEARDIRGTGLGLVICKEIVEAHGGAIGAESPGPGLGSTFWFTLPFAAHGA